MNKNIPSLKVLITALGLAGITSIGVDRVFGLKPEEKDRIIINYVDEKGISITKDGAPRYEVKDDSGKSADLENKVNEVPVVLEEREDYPEFVHQSEIEKILFHAKRVGVEPEILMAIRDSENGVTGRDYGIIPRGAALNRYNKDRGYELDGKFVEYADENEKQLAWATQTVRKNMERFRQNNEGYKTFIEYLGSKYAPVGVSNDPSNLNSNWIRNVSAKYNKLKFRKE